MALMLSISHRRLIPNRLLPTGPTIESLLLKLLSVMPSIWYLPNLRLVCLVLRGALPSEDSEDSLDVACTSRAPSRTIHDRNFLNFIRFFLILAPFCCLFFYVEPPSDGWGCPYSSSSPGILPSLRYWFSFSPSSVFLDTRSLVVVYVKSCM